MSDHIDDYITHQAAKGVHPQRVKNTKSRLLRLAEQCNLCRLTDISVDALERWMLDKAKHDERTKKPMRAGARNGYREAAIGFGNWLVKKKRIKVNPFSEVPKADANADCRRKRRALNEEELRRLLDVASRRPLEEALTVRRGPNVQGQICKCLMAKDLRQREILLVARLVVTVAKQGPFQTTPDTIAPWLKFSACWQRLTWRKGPPWSDFSRRWDDARPRIKSSRRPSPAITGGTKLLKKYAP